MRLTLFLLTAACLQVSARGLAQNVSLSARNTPLEKLFLQVKRQTGYTFFYADVNVLKKTRPVNIQVTNVPLSEVLHQLLNGQGLTYKIFDNIIAIKEEAPADSFLNDYISDTTAIVSGKVLDEKGQPVHGATVSVKGFPMKVATDARGEFSMRMPVPGATLIISFVGFREKEIKAWSGTKVIILETIAREMQDVTVSTGMFTRNKTSFTGATSTFSGAELKNIGNLNVLQSLKTLDPSFIIEPNTQYGSNPNRLPDIELRGKTSIASDAVRDAFTADPNQPLFILNGMESTLQQIIDLDINRVESVTILKDAASTALYGSKAANGVVIVETIRPKGGALRLSYNNDTRWEIADLSGYNMMNSVELLQFQKLAGLYSTYGFNYLRDDEKLYNQRLQEAQRGVNTYWLSVPLRQSLTMSHSVNLNGGSDAWTYNIGLNYRDLKGIMIGSDRKTWGSSIDLGYRRKNVNITNRLYVNGTQSNESPYGSFKDYVSLAPYYRKQDEEGDPNYNKYLEAYEPANPVGETMLRVSNPLYNASLNMLNRTNQLTLQDQLNIIWDLNNNWRLSGAMQVNKDVIKTNLFTPAEHTMFDNVIISQKGQYSHTGSERMGYQSNVMLTYNQVLNGVHSLTGNIRGSSEENNIESLQTIAIGFPFGVAPNPAFAYSYKTDSKPAYYIVKTRQVSALGSFNYAYNGKYFADATYRIDGSTVFGSAKKHAAFWSAGIGWQLNKERFLVSAKWISLLRLRLTTGISGNQQLGTFSSASVFALENNRNSFGQGYYLNSLGNENLEWQNTRTTNLGLDLTLWNNRFSATINLYEKVTDPLIVAGSAPPSTGVSQYPQNVGQLQYKGLEATVRGFILNNVKKRFSWSLGITGRTYSSRYQGFSNKLKALNEAAVKLGGQIQAEGVGSATAYGPQQVSSALTRYLDGYSADDLWSVRSAGIDPATGKEVFYTKQGLKTFTYSTSDIVMVGNARPLAEGVISSFVTIKDFQVTVNFRYSLKRDVFNTALYQKVENITPSELNNNLDRRALELRWKKIGDEAFFRGISSIGYAPMSSRFIQSESYLSGEALNVSYQLRAERYKWIRRLGMNGVRFTAYANDIFRLSNVTVERGTDYPFTRAVAGSVAIFF